MPRPDAPELPLVLAKPPLARRGRRSRECSRPPVARMLRIHELIQDGGHPNCFSLAAEFEVSPKTIQRDIDFMRDQLRLPLEYSALNRGFYYTRKVSSFPRIAMTEGEIVALLVAQKALEQYKGSAFEKPLQAAFDKMT